MLSNDLEKSSWESLVRFLVLVNVLVRLVDAHLFDGLFIDTLARNSSPLVGFFQIWSSLIHHWWIQLIPLQEVFTHLIRLTVVKNMSIIDSGEGLSSFLFFIFLFRPLSLLDFSEVFLNSFFNDLLTKVELVGQIACKHGVEIMERLSSIFSFL